MTRAFVVYDHPSRALIFRCRRGHCAPQILPERELHSEMEVQ